MKKVIVGLVAVMFGFGAIACGGDPCKEAASKCDTLKAGKEICTTALDAAKKGGADTCKAFIKAFEQSKEAWEAAGKAQEAAKKAAGDATK